MDRFVRRIATAATGWVIFGMAVASAQESPSPAPTSKGDLAPRSGEPRRPKDRPDRPGARNGEFDDARRVFEKMPPEQREKFRENFRRWEKMPPEDRQELRGEESRRRERIAREIDETIKKSGLQLTPDQREVFALRFAQERRRIEETLRKEMEAKRKPMVDDMIQRLAREFAAPAATASPSPVR